MLAVGLGVCVLTICWSAKGGSGTTVVSCALALLSARHAPSWLLDLAGDVPAALGLTEPTGPGIQDWVASSTATLDAVAALAALASDSLSIVPRGSAHNAASDGRWTSLARHLAGMSTPVVVDGGTGPPPPALAQAAEHRLLVTRPCYLSLRRAVGTANEVSPTGVVLVHEPGRALRSQDVAYALQTPVVAEVSIDPAVARAVDAGLLAARLPRTLVVALQGLAT